MCRKSANAFVEDGIVTIDVTCETHGNVFPPAEIPEASIPAFLDEGYFGVAIGAVAQDTFDVVVNALVAAGIKVPANYRAN